MRKKTAKSGQKTMRRLTRFRRKARTTASEVADKSIEHIEENLVSRVHKLKDIRLLVLEWALMVSAIIILALLQSFWFRDSYSVDVFSAGGSFVEGSIGPVNSLNPLFASTSSEKTLSRLLFVGLTTTDYSGHVGLGLADSVVAEDGAKAWRVRLRDDLKWSDGEALTNEDVIFTVKLIQDPRSNASYTSSLANVELRVDDDGSLLFVLPSAYADFAAALNFPILPQHVLADVDPALLLEHSFSSNPVSSGAFRYNATQLMANGESVVYLTPNYYYYNGRPMLDSFAVHSYADEAAVLEALNTGAITATAELGPLFADKISNTNIYEKQTAISSAVYLFLNNSSEVFSNKAARQAVQKGLDMNAIREEVLKDEPAIDYPILASQIDLSEWPALPEYNVEAAREALAAYQDKEVSLATLKTGYFPALAEKIQEGLENLGLKVKLVAYDSVQDFMANAVTARNYDLLLYEIELGADPGLFVYYHSSQTGNNGTNLSNYNDAVTDNLIISARSSLDEKAREGFYEAFLQRWVQNVPAIGIYQVNMSYYINRNVRAFSEGDVLVWPTDRFEDVEIWSASKSDKFKTP